MATITAEEIRRQQSNSEFLDRMNQLDAKIEKIQELTRFIGDDPNEYMKPRPKMLKKSEAMIELGLSRKTLDIAIAKGQIKSVDLAGSIMIPRSEIDRITNPSS